MGSARIGQPSECRVGLDRGLLATPHRVSALRPLPSGAGSRSQSDARRSMEREPKGIMETQSRCAGYTMVELAFATLLLGVLAAGMMQAVFGLHTAFADHQVVAQLSARAERAMDRVATLAGQAITSDDELAVINPSGGSFHGLRFRRVASFLDGDVTYDDAMKIFILGPDDGAQPCAGLIVGRDSSLATLFSAAAGADNLLGTNDDEVISEGDVRNIEFLLPETMQPQTGSMFTVTPDAVSPRLFMLTLRVNSRNADGSFALVQDLVVQRRIALRQ